MRRLGQNFLTSKTIARRIADAADIKPNDVILEIGPGNGILTEAILEQNPKKLIAVEKDINLAALMKEKYYNRKSFRIIEGDILKILNTKYLILNTKYKIVANIPYYITSHLLRLIFSQKKLPERVVLMVQKEVAERICAKPPHMNLLALSVQVYGRPKIAFRVSHQFFKPRPRVESAVIVIDNISNNFFKSYEVQPRKISCELEEGRFFELLHAGFRQKRKFLLSNLKKSLFSAIPGIDGISVNKWGKAFKKCGINEKARAENLALEDWMCLLKLNT